ncbi:MAG: phosphodiester glycosidase family protein [Clostridia bacterium]|nr:phosphodiester glycosidase family protein [Clostridia bacterium]
MSKVIKRKKKTGKALLALALVILLTAVILLGALAGAAFVVAKGPAKSESERLCATFAEKRFPLAGLFFTADELEGSLFYMPPAQKDGEISISKNYQTKLHYINDASSAWDAVVITGISPDDVALGKKNDGVADAKYAFGLTDDVDAFIIGDYISYRGDDGEIYCFCAMGDDGILDIGAKTLYEAANSGYLWGISVDRVLIAGGSPADSLGGGYSSRAAIGQAADGSLILIFANDRGFYPAGITYSELASLMYEYGAVSAAAIRAEGAFYANGIGQLGSKSEQGFSLIVKGGAN